MPLLPTTFPSLNIKYYILYNSKRWAWLCDLCFYCFYKSNSQFSTTVSFSRQQHGFEFRKLVFWGGGPVTNPLHPPPLPPLAFSGRTQKDSDIQQNVCIIINSDIQCLNSDEHFPKSKTFIYGQLTMKWYK